MLRVEKGGYEEEEEVGEGVVARSERERCALLVFYSERRGLILISLC